MPRTGEELLTEAFQLPVDQRTALADSLYQSVASQTNAPDEVERAWLEEAHRRVERLQRGETELHTIEQVDARMRALLHP